MTPYSKSRSSQSTCGSTFERQLQTALRREIHPYNSTPPLQQQSEEGTTCAALSAPSSSGTALAKIDMASPANDRNINIRSHGSSSTSSSDDTTSPLLVKSSSDSSHEINDRCNSNKYAQHPLMHSHCHHEPHPNYSPPNQHNACRHACKDDMSHDDHKPAKWHQHQHQHSDANLPTLPFHSHQELSLAERSIRRLVIYSQFFPSRAASDDWFRRPSGNGEDTKLTPSQNNSNSDIDAMAHRINNHVTTLYEHEVRVGKLLGRGGFCEVRLVHLNDTTSSNQCYAIKYLSPTINKQKGKKAFSRGAADLAIEARFLSLLSHDNIIRLHYVSAGSLRDNYNCLNTNEDEDEGYCGYTNNMDSSARTSSQAFDTHLRHFGYFLILDRLQETLEHRMKETFVPEFEFLMGDDPSKHHDRHQCRDSSSTIRHDTGSQQRRWLNNLPRWMQHQHSALFETNKDEWYPHEALKSLLAKRLIILRGISLAVKYLHDHHIIFRDIKPDNIGFYHQSSCDTRDALTGNELENACSNIILATNGECREIPKLFDFGLVKELKSSSRAVSMSCGSIEDAVYKLTGRTGSRRYMSPEVAFSQPYNYKVDIYSFGILLYEMSTLIQPFRGYTISRHEVEVLRKGGRPCLMGYCYWPQDLAPLIRDCWSGDMKDRPNINEVIQRLDICINELTVPVMIKDETPKTSARSILVGISQVQLSPPQEETRAPSSSSRSDNDGHECKGKNKMKHFLSSVPTALPAMLLQKPKNTAPQA